MVNEHTSNIKYVTYKLYHTDTRAVYCNQYTMGVVVSYFNALYLLGLIILCFLYSSWEGIPKHLR